MPGLVLRLWVLLLAVLFQAGGWSSGADSSASSALARLDAAPLRSGGDHASNKGSDTSAKNTGAGDCDAPEDSSEELSAVDDSFGNELVSASVPNWCTPPASARGDAWVYGLAPGGPPGDAPFKPPRA